MIYFHLHFKVTEKKTLRNSIILTTVCYIKSFMLIWCWEMNFQTYTSSRGGAPQMPWCIVTYPIFVSMSRNNAFPGDLLAATFLLSNTIARVNKNRIAAASKWSPELWWWHIKYNISEMKRWIIFKIYDAIKQIIPFLTMIYWVLTLVISPEGEEVFSSTLAGQQ